MKQMCKGFIIAFSMYSKIPMPHIEWDEESMAYSLCFFPLVGLVSGLLLVLGNFLCAKFEIEPLLRGVFLSIVPIVVTGGIHIDGFMDTSDAMASYQPKERRLEILKDSHIGAFSVISLVCYMLLYVACMVSVVDEKAIWLFGICLVFERAMSGLAAVTLPNARKNGMLQTFTSASKKGAVIATSLFYLAISMGAIYFIASWKVCIYAGLLAAVYFYYRYFSMKHFGGVTGDLAGYYLQVQEIVYLVATYLVMRL